MSDGQYDETITNRDWLRRELKACQTPERLQCLRDMIRADQYEKEGYTQDAEFMRQLAEIRDRKLAKFEQG